MKVNMKHSTGHVMEMSWSFATEWIRGIHLFEYRLLNNLLEDKFFNGKIFRDDVDFQCFLIACRRLERAVMMAYKVWDDTTEKKKLKNALDTFKKETPYLTPLRNAGEHFDDYLFQKGKDKTIDSKGLRVLSVKFEEGRIYKIEWLNYKIDIRQTTRVADKLYKDFIFIYKQAISRRKSGCNK